MKRGFNQWRIWQRSKNESEIRRCVVFKVERLNAFTREFLSFNVTDRLSQCWLLAVQQPVPHTLTGLISDVLVQGPKAAVAAAAAARQNENSTITKIACHCR